MILVVVAAALPFFGACKILKITSTFESLCTVGMHTAAAASPATGVAISDLVLGVLASCVGVFICWSAVDASAFTVLGAAFGIGSADVASLLAFSLSFRRLARRRAPALETIDSMVELLIVIVYERPRKRRWICRCWKKVQ
jgi:hypothetical protein